MGFETDHRFGQHIRDLRLARQWTQEQMVAKIQLAGYEMSRSGLAKIESGTRHIYLDDLLILQKVLNVSFEELMTF